MEKHHLARLTLGLAGTFIILALFPMPYGFYILLKFILCIIFLVNLYQRYEFQIAAFNKWAWGYAVLALLYNPLVPFHLGREIWTLVNIITLVFILTDSGKAALKKT